MHQIFIDNVFNLLCDTEFITHNCHSKSDQQDVFWILFKLRFHNSLFSMGINYIRKPKFHLFQVSFKR